jgi:hypothetical protein
MTLFQLIETASWALGDDDGCRVPQHPDRNTEPVFARDAREKGFGHHGDPHV